MKKLTIPVIIVLIMWAIWLIFGNAAITFGIHPRDISSLKGIFFAPFIHASTEHIMSNTLPILILSSVIAFFYNKIWLLVWILISISGGLLVWIFARASTGGVQTYHVGASLTIFGLLGFLMASGIFRKKIRDFLIALVIGIIYGGALLGILPSDPHISWEAHLFGFISGFFWAYVFRNSGKVNTQKSVLPDSQIH